MFTWTEVKIAVLVGVLTWLLLKVFRQWSSNSTRKFPPSLPWLPIVGSLPFMGSGDKLSQFFQAESKKRGNIIAFRAGKQYAVILNGLSTIQEAYVKKSTHFADRKPFFMEKHYINPECKGIVMGRYSEEFVTCRQTSLTILKDLGYGRSVVENRINEELDIFVDSIRKHNGCRFNPLDEIFKCINGVITGFMFGRHLDSESDPFFKQISVVIDSMVSIMIPELDMFPFLRFLPHYTTKIRHFAESTRHLFELMDDHIQQSIESGKDCFVNSYINSVGLDYDVEQLKFLIRDFLAAGSETTTTLMRWALVYLANNPAIQQRLQSEIDELLSGRTPSFEDLRNLPFVEATMLEVMRIHTLVPLSDPRNTTCDTEINGFFIPKDTLVMPNLQGVHMDPNLWTDPTEFRPDRFLNSNREIVGRERVIAFSLGKRSCIGERLARQELFLALTRLLQLFDIRPPEGQSRVEVSAVVTLVTSPSPFLIRMMPRITQ